MKAKVLMISVIALLLLFGCSVKESDHAAMPEAQYNALNDSTVVTQQQIDQNLQLQLNNILHEREKALAQEACAALEMTRSAVRALEEGRSFQAQKLLEQALGKLDALIARNPDYELVPVDVKVDIIDLDADWETIEATQRSVKQFINQGKYQTAREMLENLRNELYIRIYQLPMATYPDAIKEALVMIDKGKNQKAWQLLQDAMKTLLMVESSVPIPLINAELMISIAQDSAQTNTDAAITLLAEAQQQIKLAKALGYGDRDREFIDINKDINALMDSVRQKQESSSIFESLTSRIKKFKKRIS